MMTMQMAIRRNGKTRAMRATHGILLNAKAIRLNEELHKTSAYLAEQARSVEKAMERKKWSK